MVVPTVHHHCVPEKLVTLFYSGYMYQLFKLQQTVVKQLIANCKCMDVTAAWQVISQGTYRFQEVKTHMYVEPIIDYSASPHTNRGINQLNSIQRRGAHFIMSDYHRTGSVSNVLSYLQWSSIESQHKEARLIMFLKLLLISNYLLTSNTHQGP